MVYLVMKACFTKKKLERMDNGLFYTVKYRFMCVNVQLTINSSYPGRFKIKMSLIKFQFLIT